MERRARRADPRFSSPIGSSPRAIQSPIEAGETVAERAVHLYPKAAYSALSSGHHTAQCVIKDAVDNAQAGYERFYEYVGLCSAPAKREVYELILSEMNLTGKKPSPGFRDAAWEFFESFEIR